MSDRKCRGSWINHKWGQEITFGQMRAEKDAPIICTRCKTPAPETIAKKIKKRDAEFMKKNNIT